MGGDNIMRYLFILIISGVLFGQDVLNFKSGETLEGAFYGKVGKDLIFKSLGDTETKKYPIWDVTSIETDNMEYFYPFDIPAASSSKPTNKQKYTQQKGSNVFLGLNQSKFIHNDDDGPDNEDIYYMGGYNLTIEKLFGMVRFGIGFNQRGSKLKLEESESYTDTWDNVLRELIITVTDDLNQTLNYLTLHAVYPYTVNEQISVFGGLQLGKGLEGEVKIKETRTISESADGVIIFTDTIEDEDLITIDAEDLEIDYGLFLGVDYMINVKMGLRASFFKGLSDIFEDSPIRNNTISISLLYHLK